MNVRRIGLRVAAPAAALLLAGLTPTPARAEGRATAVPGPDGAVVYLYAHGGEFPTGHGIQVWQETNGAPAHCASVPAGAPVGHATTGEGPSGLQIEPITCGGKSYPADTRVG